MILKSIKVSGFKSFYRKVSLDFGEGITAIVGPNGCGKSNVADAIRWVLGEQNPRVLRGQRMDDTIFKGTRTRRPLNLAEVVISFENDDGLISLPYQEVNISRKLFRSGESEYRINNSECRLKDVVDLILDIGVGKDAYSLIEQKMIDAILNGKSDERRRILEEAAGVVKYKDRRRLAQRKLEKTRLDLEQIQVLFDEVEHSVRGLKRHVGKARRHKAYKVREKEVEILLAGLKRGELDAKEKAVGTRLEELENRKEKALATMQGLEADLREGKSDLISKEEKLKEIRERLKSRSLDIKLLDERLVVLKERCVHRRERMDRVVVEAAEARDSREALLEERDELAREKAKGVNRLEELSSLLRELEAERGKAEAELRSESERYRLAEEKRIRKLEAIAEIKARLSALDNENSSLFQKRDRLEAQLADKREKITTAGGEKVSFSSEVQELRTIVANMSGKLEKLSALREKISERRDASDREAGKQQLHLDNVLSQLELRRKWREDYEGYPGGVSEIMRSKDDFPGILGPVGELFEIDRKFARAIETGLLSFLKMIVTVDNMAAMRAINHLRSHGKGVASFLSLEMIRTMNERRMPRLPSWVIAIGSDVVSCKPELNALRDLLLGDLWIVPPPSAGEDVEAYIKAEARLVSLDGSLLKDRFVLWGGEDGNKSPLLVERSRAIEGLKRESVSLKRALEKVETDHRRLNQILVDAVSEHEKLERRSAEETLSLREKENVLLGLAREEDFLQSEISHMEEELQRVVSMCRSKEREKRDLMDALATTEGAGGETREEAEPGGELNYVRERRDVLDGDLGRARVEDASLKASLSEMDRRAERIEKELKAREELSCRLAEEQAAIEEELGRLDEEIGDAEGKRLAVASDAEQVELELSAGEVEIRLARTELDRKDAAMGDLRMEMDGRSSEIRRLELEENDVNNLILSLKDRMGEKYGISLDEIVLPENVDAQRTGELKHELQGLKEKLAHLGHVNFVALEEYEGEEERLDLLRTQRDDLIEGKESLEKAIRQINRTARERFLETFGLVRENFRETFRLLFRGGKADLIMADDGDPLECPIEMAAQPFGKRAESVDLMSGGERALTALALLFAIYQVRPSPFCILDEADAALDDTNVDRLIDMLVKFRGKTQFIVVTHNKKTMSAADCLYGVTMEEPGVSKVVSVTLDGDGRRVADGSRGNAREQEGASV